MEQIPTAAEKLCEIGEFSIEHSRLVNTIDFQICEKMKEFAKLHVKAALEAAAKTIGSTQRDGLRYYVADKDSILKAYPPENIK